MIGTRREGAPFLFVRKVLLWDAFPDVPLRFSVDLVMVALIVGVIAIFW